MAWKKAPPELIEIFSAALPNEKGVERRQMFGYPCAFVGGNMFGGLFESGLFVRLGEAERDTWLRTRGASPFAPLPGRVMREYVVLPRATIEDHHDLRATLRQALEFTASKPPRGRAKAKRAARS